MCPVSTESTLLLFLLIQNFLGLREGAFGNVFIFCNILQRHYSKNKKIRAHGRCKNSQVTLQASVSSLIPFDRIFVRTLDMLNFLILRSLDHQILRSPDRQIDRSLYHQIVRLLDRQINRLLDRQNIRFLDHKISTSLN